MTTRAAIAGLVICGIAAEATRRVGSFALCYVGLRQSMNFVLFGATRDQVVHGCTYYLTFPFGY